jgi:amino acid transporter
LKNKKIYPIIILIATLLMGIGYASINSVILGISGTAQANTQDGIYITSVNYKSNVFADYENSKIIYAYQTMLNSSVVLSNTNGKSQITYEITIYNSTNDDYAFVGEEYLESEDTYSNDSIVVNLNGLSKDYILKAKDSVTFTVTFAYKNQTLSQNNILKSLLNFRFEKIHYVTYENFTSTSGYPQFVIEGELLMV